MRHLFRRLFRCAAVHRGRAVVLALAFALGAAGSGCTTNPATGGSTFTGFMDTEDEIRIGRENHPKILRAFGGTYDDPALARYVSSIGALLVQTVERKDLSYSFTVLNSDVVNAMAIPGGYIYVTRGLLALVDNEAQLAAVLAHELGHLTALHHASARGRDLLANILVTALGVAGGNLAAQGGGLIAGTTLMSFSRDQEYQADELGVRYMSRAGYDPREMAEFLGKLRAESRLEQALRGKSPDSVDEFNYLATHPAPIERVRRASDIATRAPVSRPMTEADPYLAKIDGMIYGDDPAEGYIRDRSFLHPRLRIRFDVPPGFRLFNTPRAVVAYGPQDSRILFDTAPRAVDVSARSYLTDVWARGIRLADIETPTIGGLAAATATTRLSTNQGPREVRLIAIRENSGRVYRFIHVIPPALATALDEGLRRSSFSFRRLSEAEAAGLKPHRIRLVRVRPGDTPDTLARRMPFSEFQRERFDLLNGIDPGETLAPGRLVKIVGE